MIFPRYMLMIVPQKRSGCLEINRGPGATPWIMKSP